MVGTCIVGVSLGHIGLSSTYMPAATSNQSPDSRVINTLRLRQNGCNFADNNFKGIFLMKMYEFWL